MVPLIKLLIAIFLLMFVMSSCGGTTPPAFTDASMCSATCLVEFEAGRAFSPECAAECPALAADLGK